MTRETAELAFSRSPVSWYAGRKKGESSIPPKYTYSHEHSYRQESFHPRLPLRSDCD